MEFIDGADLRRILDLTQKRGEEVGIGHAVQVAIGVCRGLHHAHSLKDSGKKLGIVHRDISPHNILISEAGEVKVTDFGIAKAAERATHTGTGVVKGKLAYMAPEQAEGEPVDHRLDQFATGIVLWEMLTGRRLFSGPNEMAVFRALVACEIPLPSSLRGEVPGELDAIVLKALARNPEDRYADMRAFEQALSRFVFSHFEDPERTDVQRWVSGLLEQAHADVRKTARISQPSMPAASLSQAEALHREGADDSSGAPESSVSSVSSVFTSSGETPEVDEETLAGVAGYSDETQATGQGSAAQKERTSATRTLSENTLKMEGLAVGPAPKGAPAQINNPPSAGVHPAALAGIAFLLLGLLGVGAWAFLGSDPPRTDPDTGPAVVVANPASEEEKPEVKKPENEVDEGQAKPSNPEPHAKNTPEAPPLASEKPMEPKSPPPKKAAVRKKGRVFLEVQGSWAEVFHRGRKVGDTPVMLKLPAGKQRLHLKNPETGKEKWITLKVPAGGKLTHRVKL
jgi:serine/threonine protein kinase